MNWDQVQGKWKQMKGDIRQKWGRLTDDDLEVIAGSREAFTGRVQERYGIAKEEAQKKIDEWLHTLHETSQQTQGTSKNMENQTRGNEQTRGNTKETEHQTRGSSPQKTYTGKP